jgi:hypothetical protein
MLTLYTVNLRSKTFNTDLHYALAKSVAKARRENKRKLGVIDYAAERH